MRSGREVKLTKIVVDVCRVFEGEDSDVSFYGFVNFLKVKVEDFRDTWSS
jgi:hypothetical protein